MFKIYIFIFLKSIMIWFDLNTPPKKKTKQKPKKPVKEPLEIEVWLYKKADLDNSIFLPHKLSNEILITLYKIYSSNFQWKTSLLPTQYVTHSRNLGMCMNETWRRQMVNRSSGLWSRQLMTTTQITSKYMYISSIH